MANEVKMRKCLSIALLTLLMSFVIALTLACGSSDEGEPEARGAGSTEEVQVYEPVEPTKWDRLQELGFDTQVVIGRPLQNYWSIIRESEIGVTIISENTREGGGMNTRRTDMTGDLKVYLDSDVPEDILFMSKWDITEYTPGIDGESLTIYVDNPWLRGEE